MKMSEIWSEIEAEHEWREAELRFLHNQVARLTTARQQEMLRRSAMLMVYAHFEGFARFVLLLYVRAVNESGIVCREANHALAAASLANVFAELRDPHRKSREFRNELPDDTALHRFARDREFVERSKDFETRNLNIPDEVVDVESNLKPVVLKALLYRLGLDQTGIATVEGDIHQLLNLRNGIAHGSSRSGISPAEYYRVRQAATSVMRSLRTEITKALRERRFQITVAATNVASGAATSAA